MSVQTFAAPLAASQSLMVLSLLPEANIPPSGEKATKSTKAVCPSSVWASQVQRLHRLGRMDRLINLDITPVGLPHRPEGAQSNTADRASIIGSQIARQLDGALEHFAALAHGVVNQALAIQFVGGRGFDSLEHAVLLFLRLGLCRALS